MVNCVAYISISGTRRHGALDIDEGRNCFLRFREAFVLYLESKGVGFAGQCFELPLHPGHDQGTIPERKMCEGKTP
jgi:hypothetical protein